MNHPIRDLLYDKDIYAQLPDYGLVEAHGWNSEAPIFEMMIARHKPQLIVEVGSWKGASAIHMASMCKRLGLSTHILCVDTWLGAMEMWEDKEDATRYKALNLVHGYPSVYFSFIKNIKYAGHSDCVTPFPTTSSIAARWLKSHQITADLIYVDASHDYEDVKRDLIDYWPLVKRGGALFGDDYKTWLGVRSAVNVFNHDISSGGFNRLILNDNHYIFTAT